MLVSHKHKFIFIKTEKTAGTSIEIVLSQFCGDDDIITPIVPEDEEIRRRLGYRGPQNYLMPFGRFTPREWAVLVIKRKRQRFFNHCSAAFVKKHIDREIWDSYFKFCFERNPWDKAVSLYYWRYTKEPRPSISDFVQSGPVRVSGFELYSIDGEVAVDRVCRFERLTEELEEISARIGLPEIKQMPRAKGNLRRDKRSYRELLGPADRERIASQFAREIELFGYEW